MGMGLLPLESPQCQVLLDYLEEHQETLPPLVRPVIQPLRELPEEVRHWDREIVFKAIVRALWEYGDDPVCKELILAAAVAPERVSNLWAAGRLIECLHDVRVLERRRRQERRNARVT